MDNNGQLTFSDDPLLERSNQIYQLIEEGNFSEAIEGLDILMNTDSEYPGLIEGYRTAKFWFNRDRELKSLKDGRETADFLMREWNLFDEYAEEKQMKKSASYKSVMRYIFFKASEHYKLSFQKREDTTSSFDLLLNLGECFLRLSEYKYSIETLEFARNSYKSNARLLSLLGESYYYMDDIPKSLLHFREAFFATPSDIDMNLITAKPVKDIIEIVINEKPDYPDIREWIPVYGFLSDILYVRRNLSKHLMENIEKDIYNLEIIYHKMDSEQINTSNAKPRLINKYLWMLDYYEFQHYSFDNLSQIRSRLISIDRDLFEDYFKNAGKI